MIGNPISEGLNYRLKVAKKLPQLKILGSVEISLEISKKLFDKLLIVI